MEVCTFANTSNKNVCDETQQKSAVPQHELESADEAAEHVGRQRRLDRVSLVHMLLVVTPRPERLVALLTPTDRHRL